MNEENLIELGVVSEETKGQPEPQYCEFVWWPEGTGEVSFDCL